MKALKINILSLALISTATLSMGAMACSTDAWNGGTGGTLAAGSPTANPATSIPRVSGECGLKTEGEAYVEDETPVGESRYIARFYFKPQSVAAGDHTIFEAFSSDDSAPGNALFSVSYDGTNFNFNGTSTGSAAADTSKWNLIELDYTSGGDLAYWVNRDAVSQSADNTVGGGTGLVESVRLGGGAGVTVGLFDDFESRRSSAVGELLIGDAAVDDAINAGDINAVVNEFLNGVLSTGTPDCTLDGQVNAGDINCIVAVFLGP